MTSNGFGYVKIQDGLVCCYMGDSRNPNVHKFENDEIVNSVLMVRKLLGEEFRKSNDVEALKKAILEDKKELIRLRKIIDDIIQYGVSHDSFDNGCCDGSNESLKEELKLRFKVG